MTSTSEAASLGVMLFNRSIENHLTHSSTSAKAIICCIARTICLLAALIDVPRRIEISFIEHTFQPPQKEHVARSLGKTQERHSRPAKRFAGEIGGLDAGLFSTMGISLERHMAIRIAHFATPSSILDRYQLRPTTNLVARHLRRTRRTINRPSRS